MRRRARGLSNYFRPLAELMAYADDWRRTTFVYSLVARKPNVPISQLPRWEIKLGGTKTLNFSSPHDPAHYNPPPPLDKEERASFQFFLQDLHRFVRNQSWHISIVIIPDNTGAGLSGPHSMPTTW